MHKYAPLDYICPICLGAQGTENEHTLIRQSDIIYSDEVTFAFIASYFIGNNPGHVIISPVQHFENIYDLPDEVGAQIAKVSKEMCLVMKKAYQCEGVTMLQNNEPVAGQHAFHYHLHLFPRYTNDNIYEHMDDKRQTTPEERIRFAEKMRLEIEKGLTS